MKNNAFIEKKLGKSLEEVSKEELVALIRELKNEKKYGLVWENQVEEMEKLLETHYPMLREDADKAVVTDPKKPTNLIIEGDNLHSLNTLLYTHREKVDVIYIDPPYNTGNKDFVYNDRYVDKEDSWRHSSWLSFMEKRLRLAKELLSENGLIFISIDENEHAQLKLLCDEIIGENGFVSEMIWQNKYTVSNDKSGITTQTEYILVYTKAKDKRKMTINNEPLREEYVSKTYKNPDNDPRGDWRTVQLYKKKNPKLYTVISPNGKEWTLPWNYNELGFKKLIEDNLVYWGKNGDACPQKKVFLKDTKGTKPKNLLLGEIVGYTQNGSKEIEDILHNKNLFSYPKPKSLIQHLLKICTNPGDVVLDFFAGSGTTGHAVLELNSEDGGNRQFILCTHGKESETSELNIAEDITYERIKRVINGYTTPKGKDVDGLTGNVKYYKTTLVEKNQDSNDLKEEMAQHAKDLLCIKENIFTETVSIDDESFLFENEDLVMGIHLGAHYELPGIISKALTNATKQKLIYLRVDNIPTNEQELNDLMEAGINIKPIPKKIMDLFEESTRR